MSEVDDLQPDDLRPDDGDVPWRTLHAASPLVNLLPQAWSLLRQFWPLLLAAVLGRGARDALVANLVVLAGFGAVAAARSLVHWATLRWRLVDGRLEIATGLLRRNRRVIPRAKVQDVELVRNVFHRLSGLVEVRVETASGSEVEGLLSALSVADAEQLVQTLARRHVAAAEGELIASNGPGALLRYGATSARVGAIAVGIGVLLDLAGNLGPEAVPALFVAHRGTMLLLLGVVALALAWGVGVLDALVRHHGFALRRRGDRLVAEEGLLTRRRVELPLSKVQLVVVREPLLRRVLGFGSVVVETAAARAGSGGTERATTRVPVVAADAADALVRAALPAVDVDLAGAAWARPDPRALRRALARATLQGVVGAVAIAVMVVPWGVVALPLAWVPVALAWADWRSQRWLVTDAVVVARRGWLDRATTIVTRGKLQSVDVTQGPLQRRWGLGEVILRVAGSAVAMPLLDHGRAYALAADLSASVGRPPTPPGGAPPSRPAPPPPTTS